MGEILLNIKGSQFLYGELDDVDITTTARMSRDEDKLIIKYKNEEDTDTQITVDKDCVLFNREGMDDAQILFKRETPYTISYNTEFGTFGVNMYTTMVDAEINKDKGKIEIEYLMELMGEQLVNKLYMSFDRKEQGENED